MVWHVQNERESSKPSSDLLPSYAGVVGTGFSSALEKLGETGCCEQNERVTYKLAWELHQKK